MRVTVCALAGVLGMLGAEQLMANALRFEQSVYKVNEGQPTFTATVVYDLAAPVIVSDSYFDLAAVVNPSPGTGSIAISGATRSDPYLYAPALFGAGLLVPNEAQEFAILNGVLMTNQGAMNPDNMALTAGSYKYADVLFTVVGSKGDVFDLTFSNAVLDGKGSIRLGLETVPSRVEIVPEPACLGLCAVWALMLAGRKRR